MTLSVVPFKLSLVRADDNGTAEVQGKRGKSGDGPVLCFPRAHNQVKAGRERGCWCGRYDEVREVGGLIHSTLLGKGERVSE